LWNFESDYIINKTDYEAFARCHDCAHPISNYKVPKGKGGIAIIWPKHMDKYIKRLEDGNNRISLRIQGMPGHHTDYNRKV
jgi:hypothetical protein